MSYMISIFVSLVGAHLRAITPWYIYYTISMSSMSLVPNKYIKVFYNSKEGPKQHLEIWTYDVDRVLDTIFGI